MRVLMCAGVAPVVPDPAESLAFYRDVLGLPLGGEGDGDYVATGRLDGIRHFGLWPLRDAARSCFDSSAWPDNVALPQACVEFEVDDVDQAARELTERGCQLLRGPFEEPWGQRAARLLSPEGLLIGVTHTPWYHQPDPRLTMQGVTVGVRDLEVSRRFYEDVLGFTPGEFYEPTRWQPYTFDQQYFAIREDPDLGARNGTDIANFDCVDVETMWAAVQERAPVIAPLATTPWGSRRFVVSDPDSLRLGFVQASAIDQPAGADDEKATQ